jgi:hypothetical protein
MDMEGYGWMDGWMDGRMEGWTDGGMDRYGWMDGWLLVLSEPISVINDLLRYATDQT